MNEFIAYIQVETTHISSVVQKSIPVIGCAQAGAEGYFTNAGYPQGEGWNYVDLPGFTQKDENTYALEVNGDSMQPLYHDGDIIIVSPESDIRRGDRVVVKTTDGPVMATELKRQTPSKIELKSLNTHHDDITLQPSDIDWIARVLWVSQ